MGNWLTGKISTIDKKIAPNPNTEENSFLDICLKYSPVALLFALDKQGFETKNGVQSQLSQVFLGQIILNAAIAPLKNTIARVRPNGELKSFPSRHTGACVLYAELLHEELKENYPALSYSGYALSVTTAMLRMYHNKHWLSDVLGGALLGTISFKITRKILDGSRRKS